MATNLAQTVQSNMLQISSLSSFVINESADIFKLYFTGPSSQLSSVPDEQAATVDTKLTKAEIVAGITLCEQISKFYNNSPVSSSDYLATIQNILYGNNPLITPISVEVEAIGSRLYILCQNMLNLYNICKDTYTLYWSSEVGATVGVLNASSVFFGIDATANELSLGVVLAEQYRQFIAADTVTTGDYKATVAKWQRLA
jgi:hypothetical protein